jgi:hypothetical protein
MTKPRSLLTAGALVFLSMGCHDSLEEGALLRLDGIYLDESGLGGTITLHSNPAGVELAGELLLAGQQAIPLTGSYRGSTGAIVFASEDGSYEFEGGVGRYAAGTGAVPAGRANFALFVNPTLSTATYCGPASCTVPDGCPALGTIQVAINGSSALLTYRVDETEAVGSGSASPTAVNVHVGSSASTIDVTVHGDISGDTVTGTWEDGLAGISGTWDGNASPCATSPLRFTSASSPGA